MPSKSLAKLIEQATAVRPQWKLPSPFFHGRGAAQLSTVRVRFKRTNCQLEASKIPYVSMCVFLLVILGWRKRLPQLLASFLASHGFTCPGGYLTSLWSCLFRNHVQIRLPRNKIAYSNLTQTECTHAEIPSWRIWHHLMIWFMIWSPGIIWHLFWHQQISYPTAWSRAPGIAPWTLPRVNRSWSCRDVFRLPSRNQTWPHGNLAKFINKNQPSMNAKKDLHWVSLFQDRLPKCTACTTFS